MVLMAKRSHVRYMMQQGGVSKATKTINLSEDIFAGMDFTLRGWGCCRIPLGVPEQVLGACVSMGFRWFSMVSARYLGGFEVFSGGSVRQGRTIKHCEYFHVAKGRDLGFNTVLGFFSKPPGLAHMTLTFFK